MSEKKRQFDWVGLCCVVGVPLVLLVVVAIAVVKSAAWLRLAFGDCS